MNKQQMVQKIAVLFFMVMSIQPVMAQKMVIHMSDKQTIPLNTSDVDYISFEEDEPIIEPSYPRVERGFPQDILVQSRRLGQNRVVIFGSIEASD